MRKKLAVFLGLLLLVLVSTLLAVWFMPGAEPPLRVGMTEWEVEQEMGEGVNQINLGTHTYVWYKQGPDCLGRQQTVFVLYDKKAVERWRVEPQPRTRPPWLDRTIKWAGW